MTISILRLGHRIFRDKRITTHCALVARALGAKKFFYTGEKDSSLEESVNKTVGNWGGPFAVEHVSNDFLKKFRGQIVHLTVYGIPFQKKLPEIRTKNLLIIVGGEKVPPEIYEKSHLNLSVGDQPHSEVAAMGILLYELNKRDFVSEFKKPRLKVIPQERGKKVVRL